MVARAGVHACRDLCGAAAARWRSGGGGVYARTCDRSATRAPATVDPPKSHADGAGVRAAGGYAVCNLDLAQLDDVPCLRTVGAEVRDGSGRTGSGGLDQLGE